MLSCIIYVVVVGCCSKEIYHEIESEKVSETRQMAGKICIEGGKDVCGFPEEGGKDVCGCPEDDAQAGRHSVVE